MSKICHITSAHPWDDIRIFRKECISLSDSNFDVYIVAFNADEGVKEGVNVVSAGEKPKNRFKRMLFGAKIVCKKALELDADIYHLHDPELLQCIRKFRKKGKMVIYDAHEDLPQQIMAKHWIPKFLRRFVSKITAKYMNYILKKTSAIITATPVIEEKLKVNNINTISVCNYPLLSEMTLKSADKKLQNQLCYIGGIFENRGMFQMLDAIANVDVILHLAGNFSPESLYQEVEKHPAWNRVQFHGFVGREKVYEIMNSSVAGLVLLHPLQSYKDSLPIKMFEYMSAGTPVICSDFPLWKEIVEGNNCGTCVNPLEPQEIAEAIKYIIANPEEAKKMGENGKKAVLEKYNWQNEAKKLVACYKSLLD